MEIEKFVQERRPRWDRLERLLDQAEQRGERSLDPRAIQELVRVYRQACSDLNHARSLTAEPLLLDRLNRLTGRGYRFVYRDTRRLTLREQLAKLFLTEVPAAFRREARTIALASLAMFLGAAFGFAAVCRNPHQIQDLVPGQLLSESAKERVEKLEKDPERIGSVEDAASFGAFLFTHNIQVSFLAFTLGALTIAGGYWILFYNGIILGATAAQYWMDGVTTFFVAWVGPHGALELPAIVFAGAAGICAGRAFLLPGELSSGSAIRKALPEIRRIMLASAGILVVAGLIEGSFSQYTSKTFPYAVKIAVAGILFVLLMTYLFLRRRPAREVAP